MEGEKRRRCGQVPQEIVEEILVKLSVKSLVRFKGVSREWRGTIESWYFIEKHIRYQKYLQGKQLRIVAISRETRYNGIALENMLVSANGIVHVSPYLPIRAVNRFDGFKISEPCDGGHMESTLVGIGREKNTASPRYKVVWIFESDNRRIRNESTRCMVLALDSNTWRNVDPPHCGVIHYHHPLIHLDGVLYCFIKQSYYSELGLKLLAFDLHTETFESFPITPAIRPGYLTMRVFNHRLCIFNRILDENDLVFKIWGLDIDKMSWGIIYSIDLSYFPIIPMAMIVWMLYGSNNRIMYPTSFPKSAEFVMSYIETLVSAYQ